MATGKQYLFTFINVQSRIQMVYLLNTTFEAENYVQGAVSKIELHYSKPVASVRTDNANDTSPDYSSEILVKEQRT